MKIIIDSSVLFDLTNIKTGLSERYKNFFTKMAELGYVVVIPETALFEFERKVEERISKEVAELASSCAKLKYYGISYDQVEPRDIIKKPDLVSLIRSRGAAIQIEKPTYEDFSDAHRRACLRLSPHPQKDSTSDEMRDLIIWVIALRNSREDSDGAILISRDNIHNNSQANEEANNYKMFLAKDIDDALEFLFHESPGGKFLKSLLEPIWVSLESEGYIVDKEKPYSVFTKSIEVDKDGNIKATGRIMRPLTDSSTFETDVDICVHDDVIKEVVLTSIRRGKERISKSIVIKPDEEYKTTSDYHERYNALKEALGEEIL